MENDRSGGDAGAGSWAVGSCPILVERDAQLAFLTTVAGRAAAGEGQLVVVTGEAGAGKSRLSREFTAALGTEWERLYVHVEAGATSPFGDLVGDVAAGDAPAGAIGLALGRALASRARAGPVLLRVEDLERADPVVIAALALALDTLTTAPALILAAFRLDGDAQTRAQTATLAETLRAPCAHEVRLESLSRDAVARMAAAMGRPLEAAAADALHGRADGNAFFVEELLNAPSGRLPWTITESINRRLGTLPPAALAAAKALACAFDPVPREVIEDVVDDGGAGTIALLDAGVAVTTAQDQVSLRHALVSEVVAAQLTARDRREWHRSLATRLEQQPETSAARLTRHWIAAGDMDRAAHWATVAADDAARQRAYRTATGLYRTALAHPASDELVQAELYERAAVAAALAGLGAQAFEWAGNADTRYRAAGQQWRAVAMWLNPTFPHMPKPVLDPRTLASDAIPRLLAESHEATLREDYDEAARLARRVVELADDRTDIGLFWTAGAARRLIAIGRLDEGDAILVRLRAEAATSQIPSLLSKVLTQMSFAAMSRGEIGDCLALNREALELQQSDEDGPWAVEVGIALIYAYRGDLDLASALVDELIARDDPIITEFAQLPACVVDLERGSLESAHERLERMQVVHSLGVADFIVGVLAAQARWHALSNEPEQVLATVAEVAAVTGDLFESCRVDLLMLSTRAAYVLGDDATAERDRAALDRLVELGGGRAMRAAATWAHGRAAAGSGELVQATALLAAAAEAFEGAERFVHAADAWFDLADIAAAGGDDATHRDAIARGAGIAEPRGLTAVLARCGVQELQPTAAALDDRLVVLSEREREIALLVGAGKTNREVASELFVSEHTIRNQLVNVFAKLGISRRTELARFVLDAAADRSGQSKAP